jgi:hypothetical protein
MFYIAAVTRIVELGVSSRTVAWLLIETQIPNLVYRLAAPILTTPYPKGQKRPDQIQSNQIIYRMPGNDDSRRCFQTPDQSFFQKDSF